MGTGRRIASRAAPLALALLCLLAVVSPSAQATYPGRPGLIVFNHIPRLDDKGRYVGGLYAIRPGWKAPRKLTDEAWDDEASFAPSGRRLVFTRGSGTESGIYTLDLVSRKTRRITHLAEDQSPAFGPDGAIAFSRRSSRDGSYDLFLRTAAGRLRQLTSTPARDLQPVFTPDGTRILFTRSYVPADTASIREPIPPTRIYSIRPDGSGLGAVRGSREARNFDISPDGSHLVFQRSRKISAYESKLEIWTRRLDGGKPKLISDNAWIPAYSPSGEEIVYSMFRELWLVSADGSAEPRQLREWDAAGHLLEDKLTIEPAWQPLPVRR